MTSKSLCSPPIADLSITQPPVNTKPTSLDEDVIPPLPEVLNIHPLFTKRHIFPLSSIQFDWFFNVLPVDFKNRFESCDPHDLEALETFFWDSAQKIYDDPSSTIVFYYVTLQASIFDSFVNEMKSYCTTHNGAFLLPITRVCNLMDWAFKYDRENDPPLNEQDKLYSYHRHLIVVAQHGLHFMDLCFQKIRPAHFVLSSCIPLRIMLKFKAFNSVPATRLSDLFKVCSVQQLYDDDDLNGIDVYEGDFIHKRFNMSPVHRVDSF